MPERTIIIYYQNNAIATLLWLLYISKMRYMTRTPNIVYRNIRK